MNVLVPKRYTVILTFLFVGLAFAGFPQSEIAVGNWRLHLSYNNIRHVELANDRVFAASNNGIVVFDRNESSLMTVNKLNGLSGTGITAISYDPKADALLVGYADGTVDVVTRQIVSGFYTLRDSDIAAAKAINDIVVHNGLAYLATAYGVVIFDVREKQIKETWRDLGASGERLAINATTFLGDSVYLATPDGLLIGNIGQNLLDFNNWKRFGTGVLADGVSSAVTFNNSVYVSTSSGVFRYSQGVWSEVLTTGNVESLSASGDHVFIVGGTAVYALNADGILSQVQDSMMTSPKVVEEDEAGHLWIGDETAGLLSNASGMFSAFRPNGPSHDSAFRVVYEAGKIFTVAGGWSTSGEPLNRRGEVNIFENGKWTTIMQPINDITDLAFRSDRMYASSFGDGIAVTDAQGNTSLAEDMNNALNNASAYQPKVTALQSASDGLWIALYDANEPIYLFKDDGSIASFSFGLPNEGKPHSLSVDRNGNPWMALNPSAGGGLVAFDVKSDMAFYKTDVVGHGALPHKNVNALAVDRDGYTWIGTDAGVAYFLSPSQDAVKPIYENRFLLRDEKITAIETDGGNRKWIGTERGVWLFNESGELLLNHFTTANSPLLSNVIEDIEINPQSGEVFISTSEGLASYRSDATESAPAFESVKIYPNPVHPGFSGLVAISGLTQDAEVKITDISGKLLWQTQANGGTASWNLRDHRGTRATTGVYLIFAIGQDGRQSVVGKIAVIE